MTNAGYVASVKDVALSRRLGPKRVSNTIDRDVLRWRRRIESR